MITIAHETDVIVKALEKIKEKLDATEQKKIAAELEAIQLAVVNLQTADSHS